MPILASFLLRKSSGQVTSCYNGFENDFEIASCSTVATPEANYCAKIVFSTVTGEIALKQCTTEVIFFGAFVFFNSISFQKVQFRLRPSHFRLLL